MPDYWDDTRYDELVKHIHSYIVAGALYEYFLITLTSKDPLTVSKQEEMNDEELEILDAASASKAGMLVHTLKPFG